MAKNRRGRSRAERAIDKRLDEIARQQFDAFVEKFGRPPREGDPLFFDPDKDEPTPIDMEEALNALPGAMKAAGTRPELIYAYEKTGRLLLEELRDSYPPQFIAEFDAAIDEYFALKKAGKLP